MKNLFFCSVLMLSISSFLKSSDDEMQYYARSRKEIPVEMGYNQKQSEDDAEIVYIFNETKGDCGVPATTPPASPTKSPDTKK